jgi:hypothetical protein
MQLRRRQFVRHIHCGLQKLPVLRNGEPLDIYSSWDIVFKDCVFRNNEVEPIPENLPEVVFENCEIAEGTRLSREGRYGYVRISETATTSDVIWLDINEVLWISWYETELMERYEITETEMTDGYIIVDVDEENYSSYMAFRDETSFQLLAQDSEGAFLPVSVDGDVFLDALALHGEKEMLVLFKAVTDADGVVPALISISEAYASPSLPS